MLQYEIIIYWSNVDELYIADAPELPTCMAHGETYEEALKSIQEAMEFWIETAREDGDEVPQPLGWSLPDSDPIDPENIPSIPSMETLRKRLAERGESGKKRKKAS